MLRIRIAINNFILHNQKFTSILEFKDFQHFIIFTGINIYLQFGAIIIIKFIII